MPGSGSGADASRGIVKGFLLSRMNGILLDDPTGVSLLNRARPTSDPMTTAMAGSATSVASNSATLRPAMGLGLGDDSTDTAGGRTIQFSQSLSQMRRQAASAQIDKDRMALGAGDGGSLPTSFAAASPWDIWVEGHYSAFDDDNGNLDRDGHVGLLYVGADYRVAENMIVGVLAQFDWSKEKSDALSSKVDGDGWMVGPYLSARIHDNIYFDLRAAWGGSSNDLALDGETGRFDTSRWLVKGTLSGNWVYEAWRFTPSADLAYMEESQDAFTNSAGTDVRRQDVSLGRLQFGPEIGYRIVHSEDAVIEPFVAIKGVWDFDNPNAVIDGHVSGPGDVWGRLQGGLNVATTSGWSVRGLASWDGLGASDYTGYTLQGSMNVPLN
ncbi:MAG: autotransporter outer membrane beta-barrel domain-containing protein [Rhizobiales bacterium]|nr:autotransporter outer membrane beta-barrel domain-containing protein [Hyphomicrobiales bacterium]